MTDIETLDCIESVCRTCLNPGNDLRSLFKKGKICGILTRLSSMLEDFSTMKVTFLYIILIYGSLF